MRLFSRRCRAYDAYCRYIGEEVVIFYEDVNRDRRKIYGKIIAIEANVIHLVREETDGGDASTATPARSARSALLRDGTRTNSR